MRVVHRPTEGDERLLAGDVEFADSALEQARGLMFRSSVPDDFALVFRFEPPGWPLSQWFGAEGWRLIHMLFVGAPLDVLWLADGEVRKVERLAPWTGVGAAKADTVIELPAGAAEGVSAGDVVVVESDADGSGE
ncbi:DUF192 domain-containing protein [Halomicrobium urmianum]|uniref:DUF192 domain-containing protein n=1 Tax=Halomicrobium urmianum TaxID=1586233 RepID=UPI001CD9F041|nr:DUF192 domain-containing protein [Halomicrobium urmianum]